MLPILRILFTGGFLYTIYLGRQNALHDPMQGDLMNAFYLAIAVILGIGCGCVWAPFFGEKLSNPITGAVTESTYVERKNYVLRFIHWFESRGFRKLTVFLCFIEGVRRPWLPTAFVIGMRHSRPGSWLEKVFAMEVYKFDNTQNCVKARAVLEGHGVDPGAHFNPEVNLTIMSLRKSACPDRAPLALPLAPPPSASTAKRPHPALSRSSPGGWILRDNGRLGTN